MMNNFDLLCCCCDLSLVALWLAINEIGAKSPANCLNLIEESFEMLAEFRSTEMKSA